MITTAFHQWLWVWELKTQAAQSLGCRDWGLDGPLGKKTGGGKVRILLIGVCISNLPVIRALKQYESLQLMGTSRLCIGSLNLTHP